MDRLNSAVELSVEGETLKDCLAKIQGTHGLNYQILRKQDIKIKKGFLGIFQTDGVRVFFVPTRPQYTGFTRDSRTQSAVSVNTNAQKFDEEKNKILEKNNYRPNPQMQEVLDAVKSMQEQLAASSNIASVEEHPTISKIESSTEVTSESHKDFLEIFSLSSSIPPYLTSAISFKMLICASSLFSLRIPLSTTIVPLRLFGLAVQ